MPKQKSILIVAAERGLGPGLARRFFDRGWSVLGTARTSSDDIAALQQVGTSDPHRLSIEYIDVTDAQAIPSFENALGERTFDVLFMNAGIYGPLHQSVLQANSSEIMESFMTNTVGTIRLARSIMHRLNDKALFVSCPQTGRALLATSREALNFIAPANPHRTCCRAGSLQRSVQRVKRF